MTGYCTGCGKYTEGREEEVGIGGYEYLGHRGVDNRKAVLSLCCGETMVDEDLEGEE